MRSLFDSWQAWALLSAAFAALTAIFGKVGIERMDPDFATLIRVGVILIFMVALVSVREVFEPLTEVPAKTLTFLTLSGLATGASWLCYFRALKLGPAAQVAPIDKLSVVFVAVLGVLILGETLSLKNWLGVGLIAGGAVLVAMKA